MIININNIINNDSNDNDDNVIVIAINSNGCYTNSC